MQYLVLFAIVAGLLMWLLCKGKAEKLGEILLTTGLLALFIALAPATARLFH